VVGDAAVLIDPYDPEAIADAMQRVLSDEPLRARMRERGLVRARHFSWDRSIRRVHEIYEEVLAS
jgi:glycosyltransferase involved in cell wall biosynthesis